MSTLNILTRGAVALTLVLGACGDDGTNTECGTGTMLVNGQCVGGTPTECGAGTTLTNGECVSDVVCGTGTMNMAGMCVPTVTPPVTTYRQIEHLARPGINEALLITNDYLNGYNATAPAYTGVPAATLTAIVGEAKVVLKALYYGVCFINGNVPGLTADTGLKPAGHTCVEIGTAMFTGTPATIKTTVVAAADIYADQVFDQFVSDVMRIDTGVASSYLTLCSTAAAKPLLCGGRMLTDDTIDITYDFLLNGAASHLGTLPAQFNALVSDGVQYDAGGIGSQNSGNVTPPDPTNRNQFHPPVNNSVFPYSAAPI